MHIREQVGTRETDLNGDARVIINFGDKYPGGPDGVQAHTVFEQSSSDVERSPVDATANPIFAQNSFKH